MFHLKLAVLGFLLACAVYPALFFIRHRQTALEEIPVPRLIPILLRIEFILLLIMPVLAWIMARGIGLPN